MGSHRAPHHKWPPADFDEIPLVGAVLLEQHEHGPLGCRRLVCAESMARIPDLEELPTRLTASA